ncbi:MAG: Uma2 family endonuclease [Anaerolineae bacterium]|nr:Uma2 family endonuclease [Anaerolineae bacterium]
MTVQPRLYTAEEFERFVALPENADKTFELIGGEIVEVPSNPYSSKIAMRFGRHIGNFVDEHDLGHVTGADGGYKVSGERYAPDVGFIAKSRQAELPDYEGCNPLAPDLAVEVVSPSDSQEQLLTKVANYLAAGMLVWVAYPAKKQVGVYAPGQPALILDVNGTVDGGTVLPGFKLAVKDLFPD